jgi:hypothetical protein
MNEPDLTQRANEIWGLAQTHDPHEPEFRAAIAALPAVHPAPDCRKWWHYPIEMPLTPEGQGPAILGKDRIGSITYEVWDQNFKTWASFGNLPDAINDAMRRNAAMDVQPAPDDAKVAALVDAAKIMVNAYRADNDGTKPGQVFFDMDGDVCVQAEGDNLVFCPAIGDDGRNVLHPDIIAKMVQLYNTHVAPPLSLTAVDASPAPETDANVSWLVDTLLDIKKNSSCSLSRSAARTALAAWEGRE